jgi:DNA-binding NarL/FixJ family response regulator
MMMKILIVAKADTLRNGLQTLLTALILNGEIDILDDPARIAGRLKALEYDSVFLYPSLPFEDLLTAARLIKQISPTTDTILIVREPHQVQPGLSAGADAVLLKGFSAAQLIQAVQCLHSPAAGEVRRLEG